MSFTVGKSRAALITIKNAAGEELQTYCIQRKVKTRPGDGKTEVGWAESGIANLGNVAWILNHSYPTLDVQALDARVDAHAESKGEKPVGLSEVEAVASTQSSLWHYTDNAYLKPGANNRGIESTYAPVPD